MCLVCTADSAVEQWAGIKKAGKRNLVVRGKKHFNVRYANQVFGDFVKKQHEKNEQPEEVESGKEDEDDNDDDDEDESEEEQINDANLLDIEEIPDEKEAEQQLPDENATEHNTET